MFLFLHRKLEGCKTILRIHNFSIFEDRSSGLIFFFQLENVKKKWSRAKIDHVICSPLIDWKATFQVTKKMFRDFCTID